MSLKNFLISAIVLGCGLILAPESYAQETADMGSGFGWGLIFTAVAVFIGAVGVSKMKYRDKCIFIFIAIICVGTVPTISAYYANMSLVPENTITITSSRYNFDVSGEAKVGQVTKVISVATDVTHAAFIRELGVNLQALPGKDGSPGRENWTIIIPQVAGTYKILCIEYCGELHGNMSTDMAGEFVVNP